MNIRPEKPSEYPFLYDFIKTAFLTAKVSAGIESDYTDKLALLLAPLSVVLEYRNRGIGSKLVLESLESAKKLGYRAVFVVGDPEYYCRFGFKSSALFGIKHVPPIPDPYVMVVELTSGALSGVSGTVAFT